MFYKTPNLWSVKIQAPVRFEWAVQLGVLLPVSNYSLLQPWIHLNLTTPCPDPGAGLPPPRGTEAIKVFFQLGCLLCWSLLSQTYLSLPPLVLPSQFLTLLSPQPGASQAPLSPFPATTACLFPFHSQASRKACLHLLSSFLTSNFLFNPLLPDLFCSVERP
uniref:Uncharacterized protein n=1 Tax=Ursus maritimus TaxID=29073 RepID=A0A452SXQ8_URSMA